MDRIPDEERLYRFCKPDEIIRLPDGTWRVSSGCFRTTGYTVSVNRESVWGLATHIGLTPIGWGLCSLTAGQLRERGLPHCIVQQGLDLDVEPAPIDDDPLLGGPNAAHASFTRELVTNEPKRAAKLASRSMHLIPTSTLR